MPFKTGIGMSNELTEADIKYFLEILKNELDPSGKPLSHFLTNLPFISAEVGRRLR